MGVRVEVREGETIEEALKRFRELVRRFGPPGAVKRAKWHKNQLHYYLKPSALRRRDRLRDEWKKYAGECARRRLVAVIRLGCKRRKPHFGNIPVVAQYPAL
ncbi:MAG: 30S ribosomal protein S21 [Planctomycetes bacterium]|nr:30S ribosomal protein S21 [Planctomycetota bacterium]